MDLAEEALAKAVDFTLNTASKFEVTKIVFPFGQDFFQIDNEQGTTTAGTQQDTDSRFKKIFKEGRRVVIETIEKLKQLAPVDVIVVPGNHGKISEFMLGELLYIKYQNDKHVNVDNSAPDRKYYIYGKNLIMYTHGDQEKNSDLPLIMATEMPKEWADCPSRYIKLGHFHQEMLREYCGVKVEILPSLSATDAWHKRKGYVNNTRGVISSIYDKNLGLINKIHFNL
jgi:predicted phosphodiesterase